MKRMAEYEYNALRAEVTARIQLMYSHNIGLITAVFAAFAIAATFSSWFYGQVEIAINETNTDNYRLILSFCSTLISIFVLSPLGIMLPFSVRNRDNIDQIGSISAYTIVFAEIPSLMSKTDCDFIGWETTQKKAILEKSALILFNIEYTVFSIISFVIFVAFAVINIVLSFKYNIMNGVVLIFISAILAILSLMTTTLIILKSNNRNFITKRDICIKKYRDHAIEKGFVADDEIEEFLKLIMKFMHEK